MRDVDAMRTASEKHGFVLEEKLDMPANNVMLPTSDVQEAASCTLTEALLHPLPPSLILTVHSHIQASR